LIPLRVPDIAFFLRLSHSVRCSIRAFLRVPGTWPGSLAFAGNKWAPASAGVRYPEKEWNGGFGPRLGVAYWLLVSNRRQAPLFTVIPHDGDKVTLGNAELTKVKKNSICFEFNDSCGDQTTVNG